MSKPSPALSVIISTYQQPAWLEKVLWSYRYQTFRDFEIIVADDGSDDRTRDVIAAFELDSPYALTHVWHEDRGFRKTVILNKAIREAQAPYLIFTDGDCLARADFLQKHHELRRDGAFLSGGYFKLPADISGRISREHIARQSCFELDWLQKQGLPKGFKGNKLTASGAKEKLLNWVTPTGATWNGMNSSGWLRDILAVNGFDERMQYGGEDREMGERLVNAGIRAIQVRYSAICLHLHHERSYVRPEMLENNAKIRAQTKRNKAIWTDHGINGH